MLSRESITQLLPIIKPIVNNPPEQDRAARRQAEQARHWAEVSLICAIVAALCAFLAIAAFASTLFLR